MEIVNNNLDKPWSWYALSTNSNIILENIQDNIVKPWVYRYLSINPNLTIDFITPFNI